MKAEELEKLAEELYPKKWEELIREAFIKGYQKREEWKAAKVELPEYGQGVLICLNTGLITIGYRIKGVSSRDWQIFGDTDISLVIEDGDYITHWKPLPQPPTT